MFQMATHRKDDGNLWPVARSASTPNSAPVSRPWKQPGQQYVSLGVIHKVSLCLRLVTNKLKHYEYQKADKNTILLLHL